MVCYGSAAVNRRFYAMKGYDPLWSVALKLS